MLYAIAIVADQTIVYRTEDECWTTKHPEAKLWATREEAAAVLERCNANIQAPKDSKEWERFSGWIEEVRDEAEFRGREDTW